MNFHPVRKPMPLDKELDSATIAYLAVRQCVRDGEFVGAQSAIVEAMRRLASLYTTLEKRAAAERGRL